MTWVLEWTNHAVQESRRLDRQACVRIYAALDRLAEDPSAGDVKRLVAAGGLHRLRVGMWRVIFRFDEVNRIIEVLRVLPRGSAYRDL